MSVELRPVPAPSGILGVTSSDHELSRAGGAGGGAVRDDQHPVAVESLAGQAPRAARRACRSGRRGPGRRRSVPGGRPLAGGRVAEGRAGEVGPGGVPPPAPGRSVVPSGATRVSERLALFGDGDVDPDRQPRDLEVGPGDRDDRGQARRGLGDRPAAPSKLKVRDVAVAMNRWGPLIGPVGPRIARTWSGVKLLTRMSRSKVTPIALTLSLLTRLSAPVERRR